MALTESTMMALNTRAPAFTLPSTDDETVTLDKYKDEQALVIMFICNHCPYVIHIADALKKMAEHYQKQGVAFVAINSNDAQTYPADNFDNMRREKQNRGYTFDYLYDEDQAVAKAYDAACTPDIYVFDGEQKLAYRGQFDDTRPNRISSGNYDSGATPATGASLAKALDAVLQKQPQEEPQIPSMGCNIKWKES